ncbi:MAG: putative peroxidase-related enzyme, partial [Ramlibacter sp.]|nr:putative peroxidase-related enzyme [Ramlibacter sp.]
LRSHVVEDADFEALYPFGFTDEDICDIAAITAFFGLSNRLASFSNMQPNPEFYLMGRVPKQK